jgi:hypothetical protein
MKIVLIGLNTEAYQKYLRERSELPGVTLLKPNQSNEGIFLISNLSLFKQVNARSSHEIHTRYRYQSKFMCNTDHIQYCTSQNPKNINNSISIHSSIHRVAVLFILSTVKHSKHMF